MNKIFTLLGLLAVSTPLIGQIEIYNEDFEAGIPVTYTIVDNDGLTPNAAVAEYTEAWILKTDPLDAMNSVVSSTSYFEPVGESERWLITPAITLGSTGNVLFWDALSHDPSFPDGYRILVSRTDTQLTSFTDTLFFVFAELADGWNTRSASLSQIGLDGETVHIAFINETDNGFKLYLDNIRVEEQNPLSISESTNVTMSIYPNPAQDVITITGITEKATTSIIGMDGKVVLRTQELKIDISSLTQGKYIVELVTENSVSRTSLIKN